MSEARIAREFPDLSEAQSLVALLGETFGMAREMKFARSEIDAAGADTQKVEDLLSRTGLVEEIEAAEKTATATIVEILAQVSEQDLKNGRDRDLLSPEDYAQALTAKRTMSLSRGRALEQERDLER